MVDINDMENHQVFPLLSRIKCMQKNLAFIVNNNSNNLNFLNIKKFVLEDPLFVNFAKINNHFLKSKNTKKFVDQEQSCALFAWETLLYGSFPVIKADARDVEKKGSKYRKILTEIIEEMRFNVSKGKDRIVQITWGIRIDRIQFKIRSQSLQK